MLTVEDLRDINRKRYKRRKPQLGESGYDLNEDSEQDTAMINSEADLKAFLNESVSEGPATSTQPATPTQVSDNELEVWPDEDESGGSGFFGYALNTGANALQTQVTGQESSSGGSFTDTLNNLFGMVSSAAKSAADTAKEVLPVYLQTNAALQQSTSYADLQKTLAAQSASLATQQQQAMQQSIATIQNVAKSVSTNATTSTNTTTSSDSLATFIEKNQTMVAIAVIVGLLLWYKKT